MAGLMFGGFVGSEGRYGEEGEVGGEERGELLVLLIHASKDYGCDCLASATVPLP